MSIYVKPQRCGRIFGRLGNQKSSNEGKPGVTNGCGNRTPSSKARILLLFARYRPRAGDALEDRASPCMEWRLSVHRLRKRLVPVVALPCALRRARVGELAIGLGGLRRLDHIHHGLPCELPEGVLIGQLRNIQGIQTRIVVVLEIRHDAVKGLAGDRGFGGGHAVLDRYVLHGVIEPVQICGHELVRIDAQRGEVLARILLDPGHERIVPLFDRLKLVREVVADRGLRAVARRERDGGDCRHRRSRDYPFPNGLLHDATFLSESADVFLHWWNHRHFSCCGER